MKKIKIIISLIFIVFFVVLFSSCEKKHTHNYSAEWTIDKEATCTEVGSKSHHCLGCNENIDVTEIPVIDHSYGSWKTTKEPTEETTGLKERECSKCHYKETEALPVLDHTHNYSTEWTIDKEATCTEVGSKSHHCLGCSEKIDITEIPMIDHSYGSWTTTKEPTEETTGLKERECSSCHNKETKTIPALDHTHNYSTEWTIDKEATCTKAGSKSHHCLGCDAKADITTIPSLGHSFENWILTVEPSLNSRGLLTRVCESNSDHKETYVMPILNKIDYSYYLIGSSLCDEAGLEKYIFTKDGDVFEFTNEVKPLDHSFGEWITTTEPTEETEGLKERECSTCHTKEIETLPMLDHLHNYSNEWVMDKEPTCLEAGSKSHHCLECDSKTDITPIPALGHSFGNWVVTMHPDCTSYGLLTRVCSINSSHKETYLLHEFNKVDYQYQLEKSPLCDEAGLEKYIFIKDGDIFEFTNEIEATGHSFGEWTTTKEPTETATGIKERECSGCHIKETQTLPVLEHVHKYSSEWTIDIEATCTKIGSKSHHCLGCEDKIDITEIPMLDHSFGVWIITKEATEESEGSRERECAACHFKETEIIPILSHTHNYSSDWIIDKAATCTETGSKSYHCLGCGNKKDITSIPATGHSFGSWTLITEPSFSSEGLLTRVCSSDSNHKNTYILSKLNEQNYRYKLVQRSLCDTKGIEKYTFIKDDDIFEFTRELEELGHSFGNWQVTTEPSLTSTGVLTKVCSRDSNHKETFILPLLNVDAYTYRLVSKGTCIRPSSETYEYKKDNQTFKFYVGQLTSHSTGANLYYNETIHWALCSVCGSPIEANHDFIDDDCSNCNYNKVLGTKGLLYVENTAQGYTVRKGTVQDLTIIIPEKYNNLPVVNISSFSSSKIVSIVIPKSVTSIQSNAFSDCSKLVNVYYEGSIEDWCNINFASDSSNPMYYANHFYLRNNDNAWEEITSINIPSTITEIGNYQFYGFTYLSSIEIPNSVTSIGNSAFYACHSLESIEIPQNVTSIETETFYDCSSLESIGIPRNVTSIGKRAFYRCSSLTDLIIPNNVTDIGYDAFYKCDGLISVYYEGTLEEWCVIQFGNLSLGDESNPMHYASHFYLRNSNNEWEEIASDIVIPKSITSIGEYAFDGFNNLTNVYYEGTLEEWCNIEFGNVKSSPMHYASHFYLKNSNNEWEEITNDIVIPKSLTTIKDCAFAGFNNLINVYYEGTIEEWCNIEFSGYYVLGNPMYYASHFYIRDSNNEWEEVINIEIPDTITEIGHAQFAGFNMSTLTIPGSVTRIDMIAFYNCENLTKVIIEEGVVELGRSVFEGCSNLTSVFLPQSLTQFDMLGFDKCERFTSVYYEGSIEDWCAINFNNVSKNPMFFANRFYLRNSNNSWEELTHLILPKNITTIGSYQFAKFSNVIALTIPKTLKRIETAAFQGWESLTNVYYEGSIEDWLQIEFPTTYSNPMMYASHLFVQGEDGEWIEVQEIKIPSSITQLKARVFSGYTASINIIIPDTVKSISTYSFSNCKAIVLCESSNINATWETTFNNNKVSHYWYSDIEPTGSGNWWHYVDGVPVIWS
ncbi:MAG: leucine-rich repeat domain-containing protein [Anaeroplasmataceae bacterium]|nr:leucine-rich repeat domain-containing protein [Anaeroplasmataceae bacterium]